MVYDVHTHLMEGNYENDKKTLLKAGEVYGIDKVFVSTLGAIPNPTAEQIEIWNSETYKFKKEHPDFVEGYVYLCPQHKNAVDMLRRGMEDGAAVGVKIWMSNTCDDPIINSIIEKTIEYKAPVLIHSFHKAVGQLPFETTGEHVARLAERYPEAKLIMAHLGGNAYHGVPCVRDCKNVWIDLCCSIFRGDELQYTLDMVGEDRILFGSDMPGTYIVNVGKVDELDVSDEIKEKIYYKNACELFKEVLK